MRKIFVRFVLVISLIWLFTPSIALSVSTSEKVDTLLDEGIKLFQASDFYGAEKLYKDAEVFIDRSTSNSPDNYWRLKLSRVYLGLMFISLNQHKYSDFEWYFKKYWENDKGIDDSIPDEKRALFVLDTMFGYYSNKCILRGDYNKAEDCYFYLLKAFEGHFGSNNSAVSKIREKIALLSANIGKDASPLAPADVIVRKASGAQKLVFTHTKKGVFREGQNIYVYSEEKYVGNAQICSVYADEIYTCSVDDELYRQVRKGDTVSPLPPEVYNSLPGKTPGR